MSETPELSRRQGPVTVLALLFGLLLGVAGGTSVQPPTDSTSTRLGQSEIVRNGAGLRVSSRSASERPDADDAVALLQPPPQVHRSLHSIRPVAASAWVSRSPSRLDRQFGYNARAPPAA